MPRKNDFKNIVQVLEELHKNHPSYSFGSIISLAFADYGDTWGVSNKECLFALEKYSAQLDMDGDEIASPEYMDALLKDVENFDNILNEDDYE